MEFGKMKKFASTFAIALIMAGTLGVAAAPAQAQQKDIDLKGDVKLEKVVTGENGEDTVELVTPDTVVPGDKLIFGTDYSNKGTQAVANFVVTNPVPKAVRLAPDASDELIVSVDGGESWGRLSALTVTGEDGAQRAAAPEDVTHIRWTLASVAPGASGRLEYPAIIR
ncbi:hypothetical protein LCM19_05640 [Qipengyuania flava]|nr:hypothetical protein [Qipengyuania flava]